MYAWVWIKNNQVQEEISQRDEEKIDDLKNT